MCKASVKSFYTGCTLYGFCWSLYTVRPIYKFFTGCTMYTIRLHLQCVYSRALFRICTAPVKSFYTGCILYGFCLSLYTVRTICRFFLLVVQCTLYGLHLQCVYCRALFRIFKASVKSFYTGCTLYGFCWSLYTVRTIYRFFYWLYNVQCTLYRLHLQFVYCRALFRICTASVQSLYTGCKLYGLCLQFVPCSDSVKGLFIINRENVYFIMLQ